MRRLRSDVSHRIRRRRPSIFTVRWFRLLLGGGVAIILTLVIGPPVARWLLLDRTQARVVLDQSHALHRATPNFPALPLAGAGPRLWSARATTSVAASETTRTGDRLAAVPQILFRVQVGAFLDHRNADRLVERLRGENLEVTDRVVEYSRELHRVVAMPRNDEGYAGLIERLQRLGFIPEPSEDGAAVTAPVGLHRAVEVSQRLRDAGTPVRLDRVASASVFRVVRVGRFTSADEAERTRTELSARGIQGFVVREP